jgi:hypothetical protein
MTPQQYQKIKAVAADERGDPATRAAAQKQVERWRTKMEPAVTKNPLHPGRRQTEEYKRWAADMSVGNRERK